MNRHKRRGSILAIAVLTTVATLALAPGVGRDVPGAERPDRVPGRRRRERPQIFTIRAERQAAAPDHPCRRRRGPARLVARRAPHRLHPQRVFDRRDGCRWRQPATRSRPTRNCARATRTTPRTERDSRIHPLRVRDRSRADLEHEDRRFRPALRHRRGRSRPECLARRPEAQLQGATRRRVVRSEHRRQRRPTRSPRRSRSPTNTTGRRMASTSSSATTRTPLRMNRSTS